MLLPLTSEYLEQAYHVHQTEQPSPWSKAVFNDCLTHPYFAYQLILDGQLQGYYIGLQVLDEITLMDIAINSQYQGQGWGKTLLADFIDQCRHRKGVEVWLEVRESNVPAIGLYSAAGFALIDKRKAYYEIESGTESALIMKLALKGRRSK
ncbi:ribosomal protein S18-alanine N-acetyltransferase [Paraglaciecola sp.]|uniref:ribosomal protein S18-alanine N-acetyltransferase n=1 Tax=Paraglaciecola sp. TaxID=1920173 RepID=UPI0030F3E006